MELAKKLNNPSDIVNCYAEVGLVHIFRNEFKEAITCLKTCLDITGEKENQWLPLVYNYLAVCYRMTGKVNECERWCRKSLESSIEQKNICYEAMSKANLAFICIKRGDYSGAIALGEYSYQALTQMRHRFVWLAVMPLIAGLIQQNRIMECGSYVCSIFYPIRKRLPGPMENSLRQGVQNWWQSRKEEMATCLKDALFHAELTGHL
jgi:tetratricopeptide (TPR) repeat protein